MPIVGMVRAFKDQDGKAVHASWRPHRHRIQERKLEGCGHKAQNEDKTGISKRHCLWPRGSCALANGQKGGLMSGSSGRRQSVSFPMVIPT